jgi:hypothetical protein
LVEVFAGLSVLVLILVALFIATKTFALWLRTRGLPELLLAMYLSCATVTGYPLAIAMHLIPASQNWLIHAAGEVIMSLGAACLLLFTLNVFRANALWARFLVGLALSIAVATCVAYIIETTGANPRPPQEMPGFVASISLPIGIGYFWTTFESLGYHRRLKLRLRLGLSEVVVVNRMLLWGIMTLSAGVALVINMVALLAGSYMSPPVVLVSSILGVVHASCLFLAFHPPVWYRVWLERGAPAEGS